MTHPDPMLEAALDLARQGWRLFPLVPGRKIPHKNTHGVKDATTDLDRLRRLWQRFPGSNIGLATGQELTVIDLDVKNGVDGLASWRDLCREHGIEDRTYAVVTPSGGQHLYFHNNGLDGIGNSVEKLGPGIDVRGEGGYVVAPPSSIDGREYRWTETDQFLVLPAALEALLVKPQERPVSRPGSGQPHSQAQSAYVQKAVDDELAAVRAARVGTRNDTLNAAAFVLGTLAAAAWAQLDRSMLESALLDAASHVGLGENEARRTIRSGLDAGMLAPRSEPAQVPGETGVEATLSEEEKRVSDVELSDTDALSLLAYGADDLGNALCVQKRYGGRFVFTCTHGWFFYNGRYWDSRLTQARLGRSILRTLQERQREAAGSKRADIARAARPTAHHKLSTINILADLCAVSVDRFDCTPGLLNCQNGVIDLATGELLPHNQEQHFTYALPVAYDPRASGEEWLAFLSTVIDGQDMIDYVQLCVGYSLTGYTREECLFYVYGPTRSGKGTFTETLLALLGKEPLATEASFRTFVQRRNQDAQNFDLAGLRPCRVVIASESGKYSTLNEAKIKLLTGGNEVRCALKYKPFFTFRPQFKIWLVSNHPINADVDDDALWYRVKVIPFPHSYAGKEDTGLKRRLKQPHNLQGVLAWAVQGAIRWHTQEGLIAQTPLAVREATQSARSELDFVEQWLQECVNVIEDNPDAFVSNAALYASYNQWCEANGVRPKRAKGLTMSLKTKGFRAGEPKWNEKQHKTMRVCLGIGLKL